MSPDREAVIICTNLLVCSLLRRIIERLRTLGDGLVERCARRRLQRTLRSD